MTRVVNQVWPPGHRLITHAQQSYELEYAYRMVNTQEVREYHERAQITIQVQSQFDGSIHFKVECRPTQVTFVGNEEATKLFEYWERLAQAVSSFKLELNATGRPGNIHQQLPSFQFGHKPPSVAPEMASPHLPWLVHHRHLHFLFGGIWDSYEDHSKVQTQCLPRYFGQLALPVIETLQLASADRPQHISLRGQLDTPHFDQEAFAQMLKEITDCYDIETELHLIYEADYQLDTHQWIAQATQYVSTEVANAYNITFARTLRAVAD